MDSKYYIKISKDDFIAIGWTQLRGAVTTDNGFFVERESPAHKAWLNLPKAKFDNEDI